MREKIDRLIKEANKYTFQNNSYSSAHGTYSKAGIEMQTWIAEIEDFLLSNFGRDSSPWRIFERFNRDKLDGNYQHTFDEQRDILVSSLKSCLRIAPKESKTNLDKEILLNNLWNKFHLVAIQLRSRYNGRNTLDVSDEYDVQDLLHCLLKLYFDDIRKEEWTPSYAGGSSRVDFLLKQEKIIVEVKKTRQGLNDNQLGKQLIEDKERYKVHPDCKKLICFTYDPEGRIINPKGLQNDLNKQEPEFEIEIIIKP